jgi:hypothetical protein
MRVRRGAATAALLAALGAPAPARAQHSLAWRASVTLTGAYTQTISDAPYPTAQTFAGPILGLSPSVSALIDTPRTENTLTYGFALSVPFSRELGSTSIPVSFANRFAYTGHYALNEITSATLGAGFTVTPLNGLDVSSDPTTTAIQSVPSGTAYMLSVNATEGIQRQLTERTSFAQAGGFIFGDPIDPTSTPARTYSAQNSFSITRSFSRDSIGGTLASQANFFTAALGPAPIMMVTPATSAYANTLAANYVHTFNERFTVAISAGVTQTISPDAATLVVVQPTGTLGLTYSFDLAVAALGYAHQAMPDLLTGTIDFVDMVSMRFSVPVGVTGLVTTGTAGYTHSVPIAGSASSTAVANALAASNTLLADVALNFTPRQVETLTVGVRGLVARQWSSGDVTDVSTALADDLTRYTVSLNFTYSYPNANAARVRPSLTPLYSALAPAPSNVVSTDRFFGDPVGGPEPAEPPPKPVKSP